MIEVTRRTALIALTSSAASLAAACRIAGTVEDEAIRAWFRNHYQIELEETALGPIRDYLRLSLTVSDPGIQPPLLFDPEVDGG